MNGQVERKLDRHTGKIVKFTQIKRSNMSYYVKESLKYLDENFNEKITVEILAKKLFVSKYHLMRIFKTETGKTIHEYLTEKRILNAAEMICRGVPAQTAGEQVGYQEYSLFYKNFSKLMGVSPKEYYLVRKTTPIIGWSDNIVVLRKELFQA